MYRVENEKRNSSNTGIQAEVERRNSRNVRTRGDRRHRE
jgi:hypothetical protein